MDNITPSAIKLMMRYQRDDETAGIVYAKIARRTKDNKNKKVLLQIAADKKAHAAVWQKYTKKAVRASRFKIFLFTVLSYLMGYTFAVKLLEKNEYVCTKSMKSIENEIPEVCTVIAGTKTNETKLSDMLDEERLKYIGAAVLGLNDALVELTGTLAGLTFALANTKVIALAGIITGVAATLSMAASNYLAENANNNPKALKASIYTGASYLITVVFLVLPYLLYPKHMYAQALGTMLVIVIFIIFFFNYYISVAKSQPFFKRFGAMAGISLSVAGISFLIGIIAKRFLGVEL